MSMHATLCLGAQSKHFLLSLSSTTWVCVCCVCVCVHPGYLNALHWHVRVCVLKWFIGIFLLILFFFFIRRINLLKNVFIITRILSYLDVYHYLSNAINISNNLVNSFLIKDRNIYIIFINSLYFSKKNSKSFELWNIIYFNYYFVFYCLIQILKKLLKTH